jgi:hypothetical protein
MNNPQSPNHTYVYSLYQKMLKDHLNYAYRGIFTQAITDSLISFVQSLLEIIGGSQKVKKRVFYVMIECIQNVTRHQELTDNHQMQNEGIFLFQSAKRKFNISLGNLIDNKQIKSLKEKLEIINKLSQDDLKDYYKTVLKNTVISEKGGAGLGLIEIARKSGSKLGFKFKKLDDSLSFFFMDTLIKEFENDDSDQMVFFNGVDVTEKVMELMDNSNINLLYRGHFSEHKAFDMLEVIENVKINKDQKTLIKKRVFRIVVEMLQNIALHGADLKGLEGQKIGILLLGKEGNINKIITGNIIMNDSTEALSKHIDYINSLNRKELNELFLEKLDEVNISNKTGLGFVDMRIKSENRLIYQIIPVNSVCSFLSLQVNIKDKKK